MNIENLAEALLRVPSITNSPHEAEPLRVIRKELDRHHIIYRLIGAPPKQNLVATIGRGKPIIMLNSHIDVVDASPKMFLPQIREGKIYGRGAADAKGSLSAMIRAFLHFANEQINGSVILCCVCDEENAGKYGSNILAQHHIVGDFQIIGEPTSLNVVIAQKGFLRLRLRVKGKEAHAAFTKLGDNAIERMSAIVHRLARISFGFSHPLLSAPSISFGTIHGGNKINIVAGWCELGVDIRYLPGQKPADVIKHIRRVAGSVCDIKIVDVGQPCETPMSSLLVQSACKITKSPAVGVSYSTDARFFAGHDCIVLGPGSPDAAHTSGEYIELSELRKAVHIYQELISDLLCPKR